MVIESLKDCTLGGGIVVGSFINGSLVGFANIEGRLFGKNKEYVELSYIHVTNELRGRNIGRKIFKLCCEKARELGAKKLYIGAHPSEETQGFYTSIGCVYAKEINEKIYNREPLDIQLECEI